MHENPSDAMLRKILSEARTIAVVGASSKPVKSSYGIMHRLQTLGYRVIPVNPNEVNVLGEQAYPSLLAIPAEIKVDLVNVFRRSEYTLPVAQEVVSRGIKTLWLQSGIYNEETAHYAHSHGVTVIMDVCIAVMHSLLMHGGV